MPDLKHLSGMGLAAILCLSFAAPSLMAPSLMAQAVVAQVIAGQAQSPPAAPPVSSDAKLPAFDVVVIKPNKSGGGRASIDNDGGNFSATNVSLKEMILAAYGIKEEQLFGLPKWADELRYDIQAKVVDSDKKALIALTHDQGGAMEQPVLTDRFQLKFHHETKVLPVYELVIAKGGPRFQPSAITGQQRGANGMRAGSLHTNNHDGNADMTSTAVAMSSLVNVLARETQRIVVDKTGLTGKYDLNLVWSRDDGATPTPGLTAPSIFTALQEQLGLRLQAAKSPIETFVIDHVALPSEN